MERLIPLLETGRRSCASFFRPPCAASFPEPNNHGHRPVAARGSTCAVTWRATMNLKYIGSWKRTSMAFFKKHRFHPEIPLEFSPYRSLDPCPTCGTRKSMRLPKKRVRRFLSFEQRPRKKSSLTIPGRSGLLLGLKRTMKVRHSVLRLFCRLRTR